MKKTYKQLRKKLKNEFGEPNIPYHALGSIVNWFQQSGIKTRSTSLWIVTKIYGSMFYPYQEEDRKVILTYLKKNKYKQFKKDFM